MKKIKMGILACGGIAGTMAQTLSQMPDVDMCAAASRDLEKAKAFSEKYGFRRAYGSYEELARDEEVELVYVASPHSHHYEHIKLCLENGKHVLCEKAFTANRKQAEEVIALAKERGLLLAEALWVRYMPLVKTLREVIDSGIIGEISTVTSNLHYVIDHVKRLYDPALAGGALLDVGVYALNFALMVLGEEIDHITCDCLKFDTGVDKQNTVIICYKNGKMAVCSSGSSALSDRKGIIYGSKGYIIVENVNNPESITVYNREREVIARYDAPEQISGYEYEVRACAEAIEKGMTECPDMTHDWTLFLMGLMDEARSQMGISYPFE